MATKKSSSRYDRALSKFKAARGAETVTQRKAICPVDGKVYYATETIRGGAMTIVGDCPDGHAEAHIERAGFAEADA